MLGFEQFKLIKPTGSVDDWVSTGSDCEKYSNRSTLTEDSVYSLVMVKALSIAELVKETGFSTNGVKKMVNRLMAAKKVSSVKIKMPHAVREISFYSSTEVTC